MTIMSLAKFTDLSSIFISVVGRVGSWRYLFEERCMYSSDWNLCLLLYWSVLSYSYHNQNTNIV